MDINEQLQPIVESILNDLKISIEDQMREKVSAVVVEKLASAELNNIVIDITSKQLSERLAKYNFEATTKQQLDGQITKIIDQIKATVVPQLTNEVNREINKQLERIDARTIASAVVETKLASLVTSGAFPAKSIPCASINFDKFNISGDLVKGGIIENFGSTGIEDRATHVQMTLMDHATVFEGPLWAPTAQIKGPASIEGTLTVNGDLILTGDISSESPALTRIVNLASERVKTTLDSSLFRSYSDIVTKKILEEGLDLSKITLNGNEVLVGDGLGGHVVNSNLQRLGVVRDLQTSGENLLSDTLYVTGGRVGINTTEPSSTFVVWDQEVEMVIVKQKQNTGFIGTSRNQALVVGSNGQNNILLTTDGTTELKTLKIGDTYINSIDHEPTFSAAQGQIYFNSRPSHGTYVGWVCLGDTRWAGFGLID